MGAVVRKTRVELGRAEWAVMEALWSRSRATASELQKSLETGHGWAYSTVKTMLDRLVEKGFAQARRVGNVYEYAPRVKRQSAVARVLDDVCDRLLAGSLAPLVNRFLESRRPSAEEIEQLRDVLDRYQESEDTKTP